MKKLIILYLILLVNTQLFSQINNNGIPIVRNYTSAEYGADEQNWAVCEDNRGVIYIGNNANGVLEFDGNTWNQIPVDNGSIVRSLSYSNDGIVYVGCVEEFGYLAPDNRGKMHYNSLTDQLDSISFKNVWKIYTQNEHVYFCTEEYIYKFKNKVLVKEYRNKPFSFLSFQVSDKIFWGNFDDGLYELTEDSVVLSRGGEFYAETDIFTMLPWAENEVLITTFGQGVYIYNTQSGLSKSFSSLGTEYKYLNKILLESQIYNGIKLSSGNYAFATLNNGCLIFNQSGKLIYKLDKENGLQDFTVINLFESLNGNLWLSLNKGISFVELNSPFVKFDNTYGIDGIVLDVLRYKDILFVSTNTDLYYLDKNDSQLPVFKKISVPMQESTVWDMEIFKVPNSTEEKLLFASGKGVWEFISKNEELNYLSSENPWYSENLYQSRFDPKKLYIGYDNGLALLEYQKGKWVDKGKVGDIINKIESVIEDESGNLWLGTAYNGVIMLTPEMKVIRYGKEKGIPELIKNKVYCINGDIVCSTIKGLYVLNVKADQFEKYKGFGEKYFNSKDEIVSIDAKNDNEFWIVLKNSRTNVEYIENLKISQDRIISIENTIFKRLYNNSFNEISFDGENGVWIASSDAIYNYQENLTDDFATGFNSLIRQIEIGIDSIVFWGTNYSDTTKRIVQLEQPDELKITVSYKDRSFLFYYTTPYFPNEEIEYSSMLKGYENEWSTWDSEPKRRYTNLNDGRYLFLVKAKNIYGVESEIAEYEFVIKPPWYKTILAYFFYLLLAIAIIIVIVKIYTRRLELEKIRLEQIVKERTEEVVKQKEEIELQRDEISAKNKSITDSIEYASRIQTAVLPSEEYAKEILPEHFILFRPRDIVSGDFYWITKKDNSLVVIAADCTGHGVPGAFMSMLGVSFLNEIVNRHEVTSANVILNNLRADIKKTLGQEGKEGEAKDGMDIALCIIDLENMKMQYSGAYNPLYLFRDNEFIEVKADRMPIGIYVKEKDSFTNNEIDLQKNDVFYIFSDGFQDQFGGEGGMKFKTKNYKKLLMDIHQKPMAEQREILDTTIDKWRGEWEQVDDIIIMGIRV
ncbi:MAG: SpoIIE family protein phosphatase [Bacteroidales bacterium]|nr:SpoIIE family protein phosphatase [Bacteroidales bacterium]